MDLYWCPGEKQTSAFPVTLTFCSTLTARFPSRAAQSTKTESSLKRTVSKHGLEPRTTIIHSWKNTLIHHFSAQNEHNILFIIY
jgi:hypothetical protein